MLWRGCVLHTRILAVLHDWTEVLRTARRCHVAFLARFGRHVFGLVLLHASLPALLGCLNGLLDDCQGWVLCHCQRLVVVVGIRGARPIVVIQATRVRSLDVYVGAVRALDQLLGRRHRQLGLWLALNALGISTL